MSYYRDNDLSKTIHDIRKTSSPINSFQYNASYHSYYYYCALTGVGMNPQPPQAHSSEWADIGTSGDLTDLKALQVACPDNTVLMEFKIEKQNEKMIRYNYQCLAYPNAEVTCRVGYTSFSHIGNEFSLNALEQHTVSCNPNEALNSFKVEQNSQNLDEFRYHFECCTAEVPPPPTISPTSTPTLIPTTLAPVTLQPTPIPTPLLCVTQTFTTDENFFFGKSVHCNTQFYLALCA